MQNSENGEEWLSISDLMSGLMLVFLLIAITFMYQMNKKFESTIDYKDRIERISKEFAMVEEKLNKALKDEFSIEELERWNVTILPNNTIRFNSPDVLFQRGSSAVRDEFKGILLDFFPRYISVLTQKEFRNFVEEIRIEGHTSSIWNHQTGEVEAYLKNLHLSQDRSKNVLSFAINIDEVRPNFEWLKKKFRANGLSSAMPIRDPISGEEDIEASKRVEFRISTNAREALRQLEKLRKEMAQKQ
jgi:outer membrane protein OmpA-like peptidoglycan-associated protein